MKRKHLSPICYSVLCLIVLLSCSHPTSLEQVKTDAVFMSDGTKIAYKHYGEGDVTLVFVHGFGCDMNAWSEQFSYFKDKAHLIFIDLPGHGQSDKPHSDYHLDFYAEAVKTVLDKTLAPQTRSLAPESGSISALQTVLIGHSLGTAVCRQMYFNYPQKVDKLIDVDGVYCFYPDDPQLRAENKQLYSNFASIFEVEDVRQTFIDFVQPLFVQETPESVKDYALSIMPETPQYVACSTMKNLIEEKYWGHQVIDCPVLVFAAKASQIPDNYEQIMGMYYSHLQYCELDSIGHFIMMEKPEMFNSLVDDFIQK